MILAIIHKINFFPCQSNIGKMKDEFKRKIISEFVGLKSKIYSLVTDDNKEIKKKKQKESIKTLLKA